MQYKWTPAAIVAILFATCATTYGETKVSNESATDSALLRPWSGPYGGVPPWNLVRPDEFTTAFDTAIAEAKSEIEAIANNSEPATFDNTIIALEKAGATLQRVDNLFGVHCGNLNIGPMPDIQKVVMPQLAAYYDSITQNEKTLCPHRGHPN